MHIPEYLVTEARLAVNSSKTLQEAQDKVTTKDHDIKVAYYGLVNTMWMFAHSLAKVGKQWEITH